MKIIIKTTLCICICILFFFLISYWLRDEGIIFDENELKLAQNVQYITSIILRLIDHKNKYTCLPNKLEELDDYKFLEDILKKRKVYYKKDGFKDKLGKLWIVILKDKECPKSLFVANLNTNMIIDTNQFSLGILDTTINKGPEKGEKGDVKY